MPKLVKRRSYVRYVASAVSARVPSQSKKTARMVTSERVEASGERGRGQRRGFLPGHPPPPPRPIFNRTPLTPIEPAAGPPRRTPRDALKWRRCTQQLDRSGGFCVSDIV